MSLGEFLWRRERFQGLSSFASGTGVWGQQNLAGTAGLSSLLCSGDQTMQSSGGLGFYDYGFGETHGGR